MSKDEYLWDAPDPYVLLANLKRAHAALVTPVEADGYVPGAKQLDAAHTLEVWIAAGEACLKEHEEQMEAG